MFMDPESRARYAYNGKVMLGSAILLFLIILIIVFLHTCRHSCFRRRLRRRRSIQTNSSTAAFDEGLPPSVLKFLPTFSYSSDARRPLHDCAVCLSEFADGDEGRVLPNCNHAFHSNCIDEWFRCHSNCPLCRTVVQQPVQPPDIEPGPVSFLSFPALIGCPRKSLELEGIIVELEEEERRRMRDSDPESGRVPVISRVG